MTAILLVFMLIDNFFRRRDIIFPMIDYAAFSLAFGRITSIILFIYQQCYILRCYRLIVSTLVLLHPFTKYILLCPRRYTSKANEVYLL